MAQLDGKRAVQHLERLHAAWLADPAAFGDVGGFAFIIGNSEEEMSYSKILAFQIWIFGYEVPDTLVAVTKAGVTFVTSAKKIKFLQPLLKHGSTLTFTFLERGADNAAAFTKVQAALGASGKFGDFGPKNAGVGAFASEWHAFVTGHGMAGENVSTALGVLWAPKDKAELELVETAAQVTSAVHAHFTDVILDLVDNETAKQHAELSDEIEAFIGDKEKLSAMLRKEARKKKPMVANADKIDAEGLESCYPAIIQSGVKFNLKPSAVSDKERLATGVILCSLGVRYLNYCANVGRTLLIEPTPGQERNYTHLLAAYDAALKALVPGNRLCDVYAAAKDTLAAADSALAECLAKNLGFGMGVEFRESALVIAPENTTPIAADMVFNLALGVQNVPSDAADKPAYAMLIADTVQAKAGQAAVLNTAKRAYADISYKFKDDDEASEDEADDTNAAELLAAKGLDTGRRARHDAASAEMSNEEKRRLHQEELAAKLDLQARARLLAQASNGGDGEKRDEIAFKRAEHIPEEEASKLKIFIAKKQQAVILPIYGMAVPYHISHIKNISKTDENDYTYLRINFVTQPHLAPAMPEGAIFVKELVYKSRSPVGLNNAFRLIKELQRQYKTREAEVKELKNFVEQEELVLNRSKNQIRINDLFIRPTLGKKRVQGVLEAHANGFLYTTRRNEKVMINYSRIKHAFFQPCEDEVVILFHFHLKHGIMIGKKQFVDIQFYAEVGEISTDLNKRKAHEFDEVEAEQQERLLKRKVTAAFNNFRKKVEEYTAADGEASAAPIEFDTPFRELAFFGVPGRSTVLLQPTTHALVSLVEQPAFVLTLEDVERVHFERVVFSLNNFDLVVIFKDYRRKVVNINAIPMKSLEGIKEWLDQCEIKYTEGPMNLNWTKIMKGILDDPEGFFELGGWDFLEPEDGNDEDDEDAEPSSEGFVPSSDDEEDSSDDDYTSESETDSDDDSGSGSGSEDDDDDEDEERGLSWDELEARAKEDDRRSAMEQTRDEAKDRSKKRPAPPPVNNKAAKKPRV